MKRHSLLVIAAALALTAGCLSRPALNKQTFALRPPPNLMRVPNVSFPSVSIKVSGVDPVYAGRSLVYQLTDQSLEVDPYAEWMVAPEQMLQNAIVGHLRASGKFSDVSGSDARTISLTLVITEFGGDFRGLRPVAALRMEAWFSTIRPGFYPRKAYSQRVELKERTAAGVVAALDQALSSVVKELVNDLSTFTTR